MFEPEEGWIALITLLAGAVIPVGGILACAERIQPGWLEEEFRHGVMAFGGGALLSAVALVLVPEGIERLSVGWVTIIFTAGGVFFMALDYFLARAESSSGQLVAMMSDFLPEALVLGITFSREPKMAILIGFLIALQNVPEGFNAYRELRQNGLRKGMVLKSFCSLALIGPIAGLGGYFFLQDAEGVVGGIEVFAAAGILYLVINDIAPQAKLEKHWVPGLGAVAGFLLGIIGTMIVS